VKEELEKSEEKYRSVVENIGIGISVISPEMTILSLNSQMRKWFPDIDISEKPICYKVFNYPPREDLCMYCPTCKTLKDGQVYESITDTPVGDEIKNYRIISSPIKDASGKITAAIEMVEDITERKKSEQKLLRQAEFLDTLIETIPNPVFYKDNEGRYTGFNKAFDKFVGKAREQMIGKSVFEVYDREPKAIPEKYYKMDQELFEHPGTQHYEGKMMNASGELRDIIFDKATIIGEGGTVEGLIGVMTDITARKRAEEEIRKRVKDLEDFYDIAVGRELRMKELKEEIEDLKEKIERLKQELDKYTKQ
jgi:PAS domain S-box-containing protein